MVGYRRPQPDDISDLDHRDHADQQAADEAAAIQRINAGIGGSVEEWAA